MITVRTPLSISLARLVSSRNSDSGVVIRMSAPSRANTRRSAGGVSPERTRDGDRPAASCPRARPTAPMPVSGDRRLRSTSTASALSGETYSTRQRVPGVGRRRRGDQLVDADRNAARVLPEPVGATTRVCRPWPIASQAPAWAGGRRVEGGREPVPDRRRERRERVRARRLGWRLGGHGAIVRARSDRPPARSVRTAAIVGLRQDELDGL